MRVSLRNGTKNVQWEGLAEIINPFEDVPYANEKGLYLKDAIN